jgi:hypothetical protein
MGEDMSGDLTKYNAAKHALAEAVRIDEVKDIRDKAVALRAYAMQARDRVLIDQATEIRLRAERRVGQLLADMEKNPGARGNPGGRGAKIERSQDATTQPTLSDLGINKTQSSRWQKLAGLAEDDFEMVVTKAQHKASAAVDHVQQLKPKPKPRPEPKRKPARSKGAAKKGNGANVAAACISEVEASVAAAVAELDETKIMCLVVDLRNAIEKVVTDAIARNSEKDRWTEATH